MRFRVNPGPQLNRTARMRSDRPDQSIARTVKTRNLPFGSPEKGPRSRYEDRRGWTGPEGLE